MTDDRSKTTEDPSDLERFVSAQDQGHAYDSAIAELRAGRKRGHWIWFVFPQIAGLGSSQMSRRFAIGSLAEASAYLAHPILGPRLIASAKSLLERDGSDPVQIMGEIDAVKLRSSMTLFAIVPGAGPAFGQVLERYYGGEPDPVTLSSVYAQ